MSCISAIDDVRLDAYFSAMRDIEKMLSIKVKAQAIVSLVEGVLSRQLQPNIVVKPETVNLTKSVINLLSDLFLSQGRKPDNLIVAAFYLAYQNEDFYNRKKLKTTHVVQKGSSITQTLRLMRPPLLELLSGIPWISNSQHLMELIPYYLTDIVRHKKTLMNAALVRTSTASCSEGDGAPIEFSTLNSVEACDSASIARQSPVRALKENLSQSLSVFTDATSEGAVSDVKSSDNSGTEHSLLSTQYINGRCDVNDCSRGELATAKLHRRISRDSGDENTLFHPPAYKKARQRSRDRREIECYMEEGLATFRRLSEQFS